MFHDLYNALFFSSSYSVGNGWYHRYLSTNVVETELPESKEYKRAVYKLNRNIFGRFWDWLHTDLEQDDYVSMRYDTATWAVCIYVHACVNVYMYMHVYNMYIYI